MSDNTHDYLIVGQGLAGSILAHELVQLEQRILVIDDHHGNSSSIVAGGLINPVTGKRLTLQPGIDYLLPAAQQLYRNLEKQAGRQFYFPMPLLRVFQDEAERRYYDNRIEDPTYTPYMQPLLSDDLMRDLHAPFGGCIQTGCGFVRLAELLVWMHDEFMIEDEFLQADYDHDELIVTAGGVEWRDYRAKAIIFCEGFRGAGNPWFGHLPFQLAKGEILDGVLDGPLHPHDHIIIAGRWLLPDEEGDYRFGATMDWDNIDTEATDEARHSLLAAFHERFPTFKFTVTGQKASVRPATTDRHPFIGCDSDHPSVNIFNGFGAKGSLLIPWYARQFANHLVNGDPLDPAADIRRYDKAAD